MRARAAADLGVAVSAVEVPFLGMGRALACPEDARVEVVPARGEAWKGLSDVTVTGIRPDGVSCDRLRIRPRVEVWMDVPVAAVAVSAGETVGITQRRMLRSQLQGTPVTPAADGDLEARVPLAAGEPVTLRSVRTTPDARSGDDVTVLVEAGALRIQAPGRLMEDAEVGQAVRVSNLATGAVMTGALVAPGLVRAGGSR
ncbi:MAG: flagellar basal body P-ring formation chaperone FlgA [Myxococcota bacterium]|nr:flagellar basal body P-ring formation chaperone FlgA [Myxococcota bacterium]